MPEKFLPIGTVCQLKDTPQKVAITGFCMKNENYDDKVFDYVACYYPQGIFDQNKNILFDHDQIEAIIFMGYVDEDEIKFKQKIKEILSKQEVTSQKNYDPSIFDLDVPVATFVTED